MSGDTLQDLFGRGAAGAKAICAPDCTAMTYGELRSQTSSVVASMRALGIASGDRVGIVLPNGPHMATAFVGVASAAAAAPLNPGYRQQEFRFYLQDLNARALVVDASEDTPARAAARELGIGIIELVATRGNAGGFILKPQADIQCRHEAGCRDESHAADHTALILHTSGTTSRPKVVPLTQANLCASADHIAATLELTTRDCCLNIMPLFHIHGLLAALLATLGAGASISCTPGFNALKFFSWLQACSPSWYTAVPAMHQAILSRAPKNRAVIDSRPLRFIRSSSSSLPPAVMRELESTFSAPVIEAYGMTEAAHQMASNPLPPGTRKPGTVGLAAGPDIAIIDASGRIIPQGETGEVVIRGAGVTAGYANNSLANKESFTNGWFRTGDQGVFDEDGYLTITGRLKEIINRGGEKISPREIDDVLMEMDGIAQCITFAFPHPRLGEGVAVAVVLAEGANIGPGDIKAFAGKQLADFKVPGQIVIVDEIPKGATGKLQRIGLAEKLGLSG